MQPIRKAVRDWYYGEFVPFENRPDSPVVFVGGYYRRHWTAVVAHVLVDFYLREWKWVITTILGIIAVAAAIARLHYMG